MMALIIRFIKAMSFFISEHELDEAADIVHHSVGSCSAVPRKFIILIRVLTKIKRSNSWLFTDHLLQHTECHHCGHILSFFLVGDVNCSSSGGDILKVLCSRHTR